MPQRSSENSLLETSSRQASSTNEASSTCSPSISPDLPNAISSPAAACGPSQQGSPDGRMIDRSGPAPVPASRSRKQASEPEQMIQGICGRTFIASSVPAGPLSSWESRLRERLATVGSTESALIWRAKTTPAGQSISRLAPSMRHTNGTDCIGSRWTTVSARDGKDSAGMSLEPRKDGRSRIDLLPREMISYSATPRASDGAKGGPNMSFGAGGTPLPAQMYSYNPTPTVADVTGGRKHRIGKRSNEPLLNGLLMSYSPTPQARDGMPPHSLEYIKAKKAQGHGMANLNDHMVHHFETALGGPTPDGSSAPSTAKRGAPNPAFPFWLMGFPDEWTSGALAAMQSRQSLRRKSSQPRAKRSISERS